MSKISSTDDRKHTRDSKSGGGGNIISLDEGHNFIVLLSEDYEEGYSHWIDVAGKKYKRTCDAGLEEKGWDPEGCALCALALELYDLKKAANLEGDKLLAKDYNDKGNDIRSAYSAVFQAIKFKSVLERIKDKKTGKSKKKYLPDYEEYDVGKLNLTHAQITKLFDLIEDDESLISDGEDLICRVIDIHKKKEGDDIYARVKEIIPSKRKFNLSKIEFDEEDAPDISDEFEEAEDLDRLADLYKADMEGDEEEEYEEEELEEKKSSKGKKKKEKKKGKKNKVRKAVEADEEEELEEEGDEEEDDDIPF